MKNGTHLHELFHVKKLQWLEQSARQLLQFEQLLTSWLWLTSGHGPVVSALLRDGEKEQLLFLKSLSVLFYGIENGCIFKTLSLNISNHFITLQNVSTTTMAVKLELQCWLIRSVYCSSRKNKTKQKNGFYSGWFHHWIESPVLPWSSVKLTAGNVNKSNLN